MMFATPIHHKQTIFALGSQGGQTMDDDDRGGMGMNYMFSALGPSLALISVFLLLLIPGLLYIIGRWRAGKSGHDDPQFGFKFALNVFGWTGFQFAATGIASLLYLVLSDMPGDFKGPIYRVIFALILPSAIIMAIHRALYSKTNHREFPGVYRLFVGYNLILFGTLGFISFMMLFQAMLWKGSSGDLGKIAGCMFAVYGGAWIFLAMQMAKLSGVRGNGGAVGGGGYANYPPAPYAGGAVPQQPGQQYGAQPYGAHSPVQPDYSGQQSGQTPIATPQDTGANPYAPQGAVNPYAPPGYDPNKR
jgi:hypothetical protein